MTEGILPGGSMGRCLNRMRFQVGTLRPVNRLVSILVVWTFVCYAVFQFTWHGEPSAYVAATVNSRLLLQKVTDSPLSTTATPSPPSDAAAKDAKSGDASSSDGELVNLIQKRVPNLTFDLWMKEKSKIYGKNHTCAFYPNIFDIKFNNDYWQTLRTSNGTFYLFGAYYDRRPERPHVRILGMIDRIEPTVKTHCLLWFDVSKDPVKTPVIEYRYIWNKKWGNYKQGTLQPYLMACQVPREHKDRVPISVSVTEKGCEVATNNLRVSNAVPEKKGKFAVCVKGLDFLNDLSVRLVEWIELLGLLGAEKIFFYQLEVHPNISKVLQYYESQGRIELTPITLPGEQPNIPGLRHMYLKSKITSKRQNEVIPYNDCLYRNLYTYEYIALMDTDEVIMPKNVQTWNELIDIIIPKALSSSKTAKASYNFRNVYFWDDENHSHHWEATIPKHMHMLQHVYRSANYTKPNQYVKCFHDVQRILTLHNHFPISCLNETCSSYAVEPEVAHLQHYRADCVSTLKKSCEQEFKQHLVKDTLMWRYKDDMISRANRVLNHLGLIDRDTA